VADAANITRTTDIILKALQQDRTIVVASATSGTTDTLIRIGRKASEQDPSYVEELVALEQKHIDIIDKLLPPESRSDITARVSELFGRLTSICDGVHSIRELSFCTLDLIMSFGELISTNILAAKFASEGVSCRWLDSREYVKTYFALSQNIVDTEQTNAALRRCFDSDVRTKLFIMPGFIASDTTSGRTTTLGRGGSDYTASLIAAALNARRLEIWTDVCGMMTADPRIVPQAHTIEHISYKEALELSHFGAKVVYPPTIQPVVSCGVPILVKNTFDPQGPGTLIEQNPPESRSIVKGISSSDRMALISMEGPGMVGIPGYSSRLFSVLAGNGINIILITQASSVHTMLVVIDEKDAPKAKKAVDELFAYEISLGKIEPLKVEKGYSIISLVGDDVKNQSGTSGRMFEALGHDGIKIRAIAQGSSERNVSAVVSTSDVKAAIKAVHREFFGETFRTVHLFIAGCGNVGGSLLDIIARQREATLLRRNLKVVVNGLCNSRKMLMAQSALMSGISPEDTVRDIMKEKVNRDGEPVDFVRFIQGAADMGFPDSIFVDCTSDRNISNHYPEILNTGIGIVTCDKIANSSSMTLYRACREAALSTGARFVYDTNVGAALPIIPTVRQITASGDTVTGIEAMVSGSLNFIFSAYGNMDPASTFAEVIREAARRGYTEPDPRTDLCGTDVARKALILARETGMELEASDIQVSGFLPQECIDAPTVEAFYTSVEKNEDYFRTLTSRICAEQGITGEAKLRYTAVIRDGQVTVGLRAIQPSHPFYQFTGTDSAVTISTGAYPSPILISGAGAGGFITASGLWRGIIG